jgi:hypothetical protein
VGSSPIYCSNVVTHGKDLPQATEKITQRIHRNPDTNQDIMSGLMSGLRKFRTPLLNEGELVR